MLVRFYMQSSGTPDISPAFDAAWEQTGQAVRRWLVPKLASDDAVTALTDVTVTVPITTTQNILAGQFVSRPFVRQRALWNAVSTEGIKLIVRVSESATTANAHLNYVVRVISADGGTVRGTIGSIQNTLLEFPTTAATRIRDGASTAVTVQAGDRLVVEVGLLASGPTAAQSATFRFGSNAGSDFAYTSGLTTDLNPWIELDLLEPVRTNNYLFVRVGSGLSTGDRIR